MGQLLGHLLSHSSSKNTSDFPYIVPLKSLSQPIELIVLLLHLWLYAEQYRGALLLTTLLTRKIEAFGLKAQVELM